MTEPLDPSDPNYRLPYKKDKKKTVKHDFLDEKSRKNMSTNHTQVLWSPDKVGAYRRGPLDWTLDELIEYRKEGHMPQRIPDVDILYKLGTMGLTQAAVCDIFRLDIRKFHENPIWKENHAQGLAECASKIRSSLVNDALEKDILTAKIHLDKVLNGENKKIDIQVSHSNELSEVDTSKLLEVMFDEQDTDE